METKNELAVVDEMQSLEESYAALVENNDTEKAMELAKTVIQRAEKDIVAVWKERRSEMRKIIDRREAEKNKIKAWTDCDARVKNLKKHHPELYDVLEDAYWRDLPFVLKNWSCKGNEKFACGNVKEQYDYAKSVCSAMFDNEEELHIHWTRWQHNMDLKFLEKYPKIKIVYPSGNGYLLHKKSHRASDSPELVDVYIFPTTMQFIGERLYWDSVDLCTRCFKHFTMNGCEHCHGPTDKVGKKIVCLDCGKDGK